MLFISLQSVVREMDATVEKRRISRKKLSNITFPEDVVCHYSRLSHLLSHTASRKWLLYEWQYDEIDDAFFHKCRTFEMLVTAKFPQLKTRNLIPAEWRFIRRKIVGSSKCRRFSSKFIIEQRTELAKYRCSYRILQENNHHDQLAKLNAFQDDANGFVSTLDAPQSHSNHLFRMFVDVKKLFATKSALVAKLREINNNRAEMQQKQQQQQQQQEHHTIFNGNLTMEPITPIANASAIKVIAKIRDCNTQITAKFNQMMCFRIVKDALLFNAMKRKHIAVAFSPAYFHRISAVQVYESQRLYRSETFITATHSQTFLNTLLVQVLIIIHASYEVMTKSVENFADDLVNQHLDVIKVCATSDVMNHFKMVCAPKFFDILRMLNDLLA